MLLFGFLSLIPLVIIKKTELHTQFLKIHMLRGALLYVGMSSWIYGLNLVPISTATVVSFSIPLFVLVLGKFFLKENIFWQRWLVTILGFIGVLITVSPHFSQFNSQVWVLLLSALFFASLDVINKIFINKEGITLMIFYSSFFTSLISLPFALYYWGDINQYQILLLILLGIGSNLILYCLLKAFKLSDATALAPYRYLELFMSISLGALLFNENPTISALIGALIVIPSTLFIIYSEKKHAAKN